LDVFIALFSFFDLEDFNMHTPGRLAAELDSDFGPGGPTKRTLFREHGDDEDSGLGMEEVWLILLLCYEYFFLSRGSPHSLPL
jgi:hypothetical protein